MFILPVLPSEHLTLYADSDYFNDEYNRPNNKAGAFRL